MSLVLLSFTNFTVMGATNKKEAKTVLLPDIPADVNGLINREQSRLNFIEGLNLKKHHVVYRMLREWHNLNRKINVS